MKSLSIESRGRIRHAYWLKNRWQNAADEYEGPGDLKLITNYRPPGFQAPVDVEEIGGLIVWDQQGGAHHFRLYRDGRASFICSPKRPDAPIAIDPINNFPPHPRVYITDGVPEAVTTALDALDLTPTWGRACDDGAHEFTVDNSGTKYAVWSCDRCSLFRDTVSWIGHAVPGGWPE